MIRMMLVQNRDSRTPVRAPHALSGPQKCMIYDVMRDVQSLQPDSQSSRGSLPIATTQPSGHPYEGVLARKCNRITLTRPASWHRYAKESD
jgi:hypothetical protein